MLSKIPEQYLESLTVRDLEELLERKMKSNSQLSDLMRERDHLRLELRRVEDQIEAIEKRERGENGTSSSGYSLGSGGRGLGSFGSASTSYRSGVGGAAGAGPLSGTEPSSRTGAFGSPDSNGGSASTSGGAVTSGGESAEGEPAHSFLAGKRKKNLKDYIAQVLLQANEPLSPSDIQKQLPEVGYVSNSTNPRSFYNTVFQALQRYDIFEKEHKKYGLSDEALRANGVREILPKKKTRLKDYIIEVLDKADQPLKVSEIASRVVIAGYDTDLEMDELNQRVSATLKKYLNKDFDWDSQRYRLATPN